MILRNKTRQGQLIETIKNGCLRVLPYDSIELDNDNIAIWELERAQKFFEIENKTESTAKQKKVKENPPIDFEFGGNEL